MFAILLNGLSICIGSLIGHFFKRKSSPKVTKAIVLIIGLQLLAMGMKDAINFENGMLNTVYLVVGVVVGEIINIDKRLRYMGIFLQRKIAKGTHGVVKGFVVATLIFCIGSMAVIGPLKIAANGDSSIIYVKTILDGVMALILASTYGLGVIFAAFMVVAYQGIILLFSDILLSIADSHVINQLSSIGGVLLLGLAFTLLFENKNLKVSNMLPAMFLPIIIAIGKHIINIFI